MGSRSAQSSSPISVKPLDGDSGLAHGIATGSWISRNRRTDLGQPRFELEALDALGILGQARPGRLTARATTWTTAMAASAIANPSQSSVEVSLRAPASISLSGVATAMRKVQGPECSGTVRITQVTSPLLTVRVSTCPASESDTTRNRCVATDEAGRRCDDLPAWRVRPYRHAAGDDLVFGIDDHQYRGLGAFHLPERVRQVGQAQIDAHHASAPRRQAPGHGDAAFLRQENQ